MTDRIIVKDLELWINIGITPLERADTQRLYLDLELFTDLAPAGLLDDISKTIDYSIVCSHIRSIADCGCHTLEALGEKIAASVKSMFSPERVRLQIRKPGALVRKGAAYGGIEIER